MRRSTKRAGLTARSGMVLGGILTMACATARGDFSYEETAQITGGSVVGLMKVAGAFSRQARQANEPIVSTVTIQGNRMIRVDKLQSEIVDLDAGTVTMVDHAKKQYTTVTFEQLRAQLDAQIAKAKAQQAKQQPQPTADPQAQKVDMSFNVKVRNTGASKEVMGLAANESILSILVDAKDKESGNTGSLAITNDMYLAPEVPGYDEVREFYQRYAVKMGTVMSGAVTPQMLGALQQPGAGKAMADMVQEMSKLKGIPVLQIMRMGTTVDGLLLPAASEAPLPAGPAMPTASDVAKAAVLNSLPFGGFAKKKKQEEPAAGSSAQVSSAVLLETNTQMTSYSRAAVDSSVFAPPAGYKQVEPKQLE
jgi:hypothetical protein